MNRRLCCCDLRSWQLLSRPGRGLREYLLSHVNLFVHPLIEHTSIQQGHRVPNPDRLRQGSLFIRKSDHGIVHKDQRVLLPHKNLMSKIMMVWDLGLRMVWDSPFVNNSSRPALGHQLVSRYENPAFAVHVGPRIRATYELFSRALYSCTVTGPRGFPMHWKQAPVMGCLSQV